MGQEELAPPLTQLNNHSQYPGTCRCEVNQSYYMMVLAEPSLQGAGLRPARCHVSNGNAGAELRLGTRCQAGGRTGARKGWRPARCQVMAELGAA